MKKLNVKKLVAVGTGVALLAAAVMGAGIEKTNILDTTGHAVLVNGIVVGQTALQSDFTAAQSLATTIANVATYTTEGETVMVPTETCVDATDSVNEDYDYRYHSTMNAENTDDISSSTTINDTKLSFLIGNQNNGSKSQKIDGSTYSVTMKEKLVLTADSYYEDHKDVQELVTKINNNGLQYEVTCSGSLDFDVNSSTWQDGSDDYVQVPFLGKWYVIDQVTENTDELQLVKSSAPVSYAVGQEIADLAGRDGKTYYVKVDAGFVADTTNYVTLALYDSATGKQVDIEDFASGDVTFYGAEGDEVLEDTLYVDSVQKTTQNSSDVFTARIRTGTGRVVLKDGYCYPDYTENDTDKCDWVSFVTIADTGILTNYGIKNTNKYEFSSRDELLLPGDVAYFPENFAAFKFVGLQLPQYNSPRAKDTYSVKIGTEIDNASGNASDTGIILSNGDTEHQIPFYYYLGEFSLGVDEKEGVNIEFDGVDHFIAFKNVSATNLGRAAVGDGVYNSSETYSYTEDLTLDDINNTAVDLLGQDDYTVTYKMAVDDDSNTYNVWLVLSTTETFASTDPTASSIDVSFRGTDNDESDDMNVTIMDENYYLPKNTDFKGIDSWTETLLEADNNYFTAVFDVTVGGYTARVNIDTETGLLTDEDITENSLSWAANVGAIDNDTNFNFTAANSLYMESGKVKRFMNLTGTDYKIVDDYFEVIVPDATAELEYYLYGASTVINAEGQVCTTTDVETTTDPVVMPYTGASITPIIAGAQGAGNYIVIGGYIVNTLFPTELTEKLVMEGQQVSEVFNGNIILAGFTAQDTTDVVDALIATLEAEDVVIPTE